ncbi:MAG TPA: S-adenosylmethionine:tRNA ribosyltransferase-isomerase, partial [Vicinamibacterales bacterium]|nr:S-adenosylmethionine:tRNA ribosyltransferase-isomerase [Vicinamibacterales bacterium]
MLVSDFDFDLPGNLIAQEPAARGASRLLVLHRETGTIDHASVADLPQYLTAADLLVVNNTRVFAARLLGRRVPGGGAVECLLVRRTGEVDEWEALMHPGQKLKAGAVVRFEGEAGALMGEVLERHFFGRRTIRLRAESGGDVGALIDALGHMPLPPYIKRQDTAADRERYQTVYAAVRGSIAAPTAGLHFTPELLRTLSGLGVQRTEVTLHV